MGGFSLLLAYNPAQEAKNEILEHMYHSETRIWHWWEYSLCWIELCCTVDWQGKKSGEWPMHVTGKNTHTELVKACWVTMTVEMEMITVPALSVFSVLLDSHYFLYNPVKEFSFLPLYTRKMACTPKVNTLVKSLNYSWTLLDYSQLNVFLCSLLLCVGLLGRVHYRGRLLEFDDCIQVSKPLSWEATTKRSTILTGMSGWHFAAKVFTQELFFPKVSSKRWWKKRLSRGLW